MNIGEYLVRDFVSGDAPAIARYANNKKMWINLRAGFPHPYRQKDAEDFVARARGSWAAAAPRSIPASTWSPSRKF